MNKNLDLTKILEGCPKGTELYSTVYGKVRFEGISNSAVCPIEIKDMQVDHIVPKYRNNEM